MLIFSNDIKQNLLFKQALKVNGLAVAICIERGSLNTVNLDECVISKGSMIFKNQGSIISINNMTISIY
jgi:hypothetical protein